jgi:hypothetical protein
MPIDLIHQDLTRLIKNDIENFVAALIANRIKGLKEMEGTRTQWTVHDKVWVEKKVNFLKKHQTKRLFKLLTEMYKLGYRLFSINEKGLLEGKLFFKAQDKEGHKYTGYLDPCGNLTLSIMSKKKSEKTGDDKVFFFPVLRILFRGKNLFTLKHTIIQALMQSAGF